MWRNKPKMGTEKHLWHLEFQCHWFQWSATKTLFRTLLLERLGELIFMNKASLQTEGTDHPLLLPRKPFLSSLIHGSRSQEWYMRTKKVQKIQKTRTSLCCNSKVSQVTWVFSSDLENNAKLWVQKICEYFPIVKLNLNSNNSNFLYLSCIFACRHHLHHRTDFL